MSADHEHDVIDRLADLRRKLTALPSGPDADDARAAFEALIATLGRVGYDLRGV